MPAIALARTAPIPDRTAIDLMTVRALVEELRHTPNPDTGGKAHSLSEIARIAGASVGWPAMVLAKPAHAKSIERASRFASPLRRYLRKLVEERGDDS